MAQTKDRHKKHLRFGLCGRLLAGCGLKLFFCWPNEFYKALGLTQKYGILRGLSRGVTVSAKGLYIRLISINHYI